MTKEKPIHFQTIQDQHEKRKNTIVVEEDSEGDKSQMEIINETSQMLNVDEI